MKPIDLFDTAQEDAERACACIRGCGGQRACARWHWGNESACGGDVTSMQARHRGWSSAYAASGWWRPMLRRCGLTQRRAPPLTPHLRPSLQPFGTITPSLDPHWTACLRLSSPRLRHTNKFCVIVCEHVDLMYTNMWEIFYELLCTKVMLMNL